MQKEGSKALRQEGARKKEEGEQQQQRRRLSQATRGEPQSVPARPTILGQAPVQPVWCDAVTGVDAPPSLPPDPRAVSSFRQRRFRLRLQLPNHHHRLLPFCRVSRVSCDPVTLSFVCCCKVEGILFLGKSGWRIARYGDCKRRNVDCLIARTGKRERQRSLRLMLRSRF